YQTDPNDGYALDVIGSGGNSGRSGEYMVNTEEDWRMEIAPGIYKMAVVTGSDGYGADPVDVMITGKGCDSAPPLTLAYAKGVSNPRLRSLPPWLAGELPWFKTISFDDRLYQKKLVEGPSKLTFLIGPQPKITAQVLAGNIGIDKTKLAVIIDEGTTSQKIYRDPQFSDYSEVMGLTAPREIDFSVNLKTIGDTLAEGDHQVTFYAGNAIGTTYEAVKVKMINGLQLVGTPITFPSPLRLASDQLVMFQYGLTKDANIDIYIFDISGTVIKKLSYGAGQSGGHVAGTANPNKIFWDLKTDQGARLGAGIYVWTIVSRDDNRVLGKGKLPAYP
ncbi:MAG TPA: hypothetical protein VMD02_00080, partial [Candidatus Omnitrophota bacterium]|nr:hypothetical protein [Candidatus Omnitrophota bacterium]